MHPCRLFAFVAASSLAACSSWSSRIASSVPLTPGHVRVLAVTAAQPKDIELEVWNRGPGKVSFRIVDAADATTTSGVMEPGAREHRWQLTTERLAIELTTHDRPSTVGYVVRGHGSITTEVLMPQR
jgi:hypothetical protein